MTLYKDAQSFDAAIESNESMTIEALDPVISGESSVSGSSVARSNGERAIATLTLPLPDQLAPYSTDLEWNAEENSVIQDVVNNFANNDFGIDNDTGKALQSYLTSIISGATSAFGGRHVLASRGQAIDPLKEVLFNGVNHRTFDFTWSLAPKNETEYNNLKSIITSLQQASHPSKSDRGGIFKLPNHFKIKWNNVNLPAIGNCVCTNISVDYNSNNGPRFFKDNNPAFFKLSMSFTELEIRTSELFV